MGAGTGYWARCLRAAGADVSAVDKDPTSKGGSAAKGGSAPRNEYHGDAAAWTEVAPGGPESAGGRVPGCGSRGAPPPRGLFLCYPPPNDAMATDALDALVAAEASGEAASSATAVVAVAGEWDGNTADGAFAEALRRRFRLVRRVPLPQWGDTAHELTLWTSRRRGGRYISSDDDASAADETSACSMKSGDASDDPKARDDPKVRDDPKARFGSSSSDPRPFARCAGCGASGSAALRRCAYCREAAYCSARCAEEDRERHAGIHRARLVPFPSAEKDEKKRAAASGRRGFRRAAPSFDDDADFEPFEPTRADGQ